MRELLSFPWCHTCLCTLDDRITTSNAIQDTWQRCCTFVLFCRVELRCWSLGPGKRPAQTTAACLTRSQSQPRSSNLGCCAVTAQVKAHTRQRRDWILHYYMNYQRSCWLLFKFNNLVVLVNLYIICWYLNISRDRTLTLFRVGVCWAELVCSYKYIYIYM